MRMRTIALASGCLLSTVACMGMPGLAERQGTVSVQVGYSGKGLSASPFRTTYVDVGQIVKASVSVTGPGIGGPIAAGAPLTISNGSSTAVLQVVVPVGANRVITAKALDHLGQPRPVGHDIKGISNVAIGMNPAVEVSPRTTLTAKVIEALLAAASPYAETVNAAQLQAVIDAATQPQPPSASGPPFVTHPSLIDAQVLATAIVANGGAVPAQVPANAFIQAGTITGQVSGLTSGETAIVQADDPSSEPVTTSAGGNFVITGVTPGAGISVRVRSADAAVASTTVAVTAGGSVVANLAVPSDGYLSNALYQGAGLSNAVVRWTRMPIRVLFVRHSNPSLLSWHFKTHEETAIFAFNRWSENLGGLISYAFSNVLDNDANLAARKAAADIVVEWTADMYGGLLGDTTPSASVCSSCTPKANDLQMHVKLHTMKSSGYTYLEPFNLPHVTFTQFRAANVHHVGHALGLIGDPTTMGHSPDMNDVMYGHSPMPMTPTNLLPSLRDINTLKQLYSRPADITRS